jgi:hypothetical protein
VVVVGHLHSRLYKHPKRGLHHKQASILLQLLAVVVLVLLVKLQQAAGLVVLHKKASP